MLLSSTQVFAFLATALALTAAPGPDNLMILSIGMSRGRAQGVAFGLGCAFGCLSHTLLAALGISALIAASPHAFFALKLCGGLYLGYLGVQALRGDGHLTLTSATTKTPLLGLFLKGLLANAINPKVVLFFLSLLPQFIHAERGHVAWQTAQFGLIFTAQAALLFALLGAFSGIVGRWLQAHAHAGKWLDRLAGSFLIALGIRLIVTR